jgi:hypothetical protein
VGRTDRGSSIGGHDGITDQRLRFGTSVALDKWVFVMFLE